MSNHLLKNLFRRIENWDILMTISGILCVVFVGSACNLTPEVAGEIQSGTQKSIPTAADRVVPAGKRDDQEPATTDVEMVSPTSTSRPTASPGKPDLVVKGVSIGQNQIQKEAQPYTKLSATVKNVGSAPVPEKTFHMRLYLNGEPQSAWMTARGKIPAGEEITREIVVGGDPSWKLGRYRASIKVDDDDRIAEANENNNRSNPVSFTIYRPDTPDLIVSKIYMSRGSISWGERPWTWVTYTVKNIGDGPVEGDLVYNRIWTDGYIQKGWADVNGSIPPGGTRTQRFAVGHEGPIGEHSVRVEVDYRDFVVEGREDNNMSDAVTYDVLPPTNGE